MSYVAIGLFVLACGWNVYRLFLPTRSAAIRVEGHPQYFGAALAAGYVGFLAVFLHAAALKHDGYRQVIGSLVALAPKAAEDNKSDNSATQSPSSAATTDSISIVVGDLLIDHAELTPLRNSTSVQSSAASAPTTSTKKSADPYETALGIALWSAMLALILPLLLNAPFYWNARLRFLAGRKNFNEIEEAAVEAIERQTSLLLTLNSGKAYVGIPSEFDPNGDEAEWLRIWPIASGYRTRKGRLRLTTSYEEAYEHISSDGDGPLSLNDFEVLLPLSGIASVQRFRLRFYLDHFASEGAPTSEDEDFLDALVREGVVQPAHSITGEDLVSAGEAAVKDPGVGAVPVPQNEGTQSLSMTRPNPWEKHVPDLWLRFLKWTYHGCITASVAFLPFNYAVSALLMIVGMIALASTLEPAEEAFGDLIGAIRDSGQ